MNWKNDKDTILGLWWISAGSSLGASLAAYATAYLEGDYNYAYIWFITSGLIICLVGMFLNYFEAKYLGKPITYNILVNGKE